MNHLRRNTQAYVSGPRRCSEVDKFLLTYVILKLKLIKGKCIIFVNEVDRCYRLKLFLEQFFPTILGYHSNDYISDGSVYRRCIDSQLHFKLSSKLGETTRASDHEFFSCDRLCLQHSRLYEDMHTWLHRLLRCEIQLRPKHPRCISTESKSMLGEVRRDPFALKVRWFRRALFSLDVSEPRGWEAKHTGRKQALVKVPTTAGRIEHHFEFYAASSVVVDSTEQLTHSQTGNPSWISMYDLMFLKVPWTSYWLF